MTKIILLLKGLIRALAKFLSIFWSSKLAYLIFILKREFVTQLQKKRFKSFGKGSLLGLSSVILNPKYISVGHQSSFGNRLTLTCYDRTPFGEEHYSPSIQIGDGVSIGEDAHITCINKIVIGNNVLAGKKITITDNSHGNNTFEETTIAPNKRQLFSKGSVIIEDNVWIGDKATILPGVHIGYGAIIGANAVVTKDVVARTIVGGNPGKVLKKMEALKNKQFING